MIITANLKNELEKIYKDTNQDVVSVSVGKKETGGIKTNEDSIVFRVKKKKSIADIPEDQLLPKTLFIDGQEIKTDIKEEPEEFKAMACFNDSDPDIQRLRGNPNLLTPIMGGQEIVQFPTGFEDLGGGNFSFTVGTLGFFAIDEEDDNIVAVTNNHVIVENGLLNSDRANDTGSNIFDSRGWLLGGNYSPSAASRDESYFDLFKQTARHIKRYYPFTTSGINYVDVALLIMNSTYISSSSYQVHNPISETAYTNYLPFATGAEIDSLLSTPRTIYSTGRTTGPKGWGTSPSCRLVITELGVTAGVNGLADTPLTFGDCVRFEFEDGSNYPINSGDSGSAVIADFDGVRKIVGLAFAGTTTSALFCRIDRVAEAIKIREWDSSYNYNNNDQWIFGEVFIEEISGPNGNNVTTEVECNPVFQIGTTNGSHFTTISEGQNFECAKAIIDNPRSGFSGTTTTLLRFGDPVKANNNYVAVGVPREGNPSGNNSGAVYVFNNLSGTLEYVIPAPDEVISPRFIPRSFGSAVDSTNTRLLIGCSGTQGEGNASIGGAYMVDISNGNILYRIDNPYYAGVYIDLNVTFGFGGSVAISDTYFAIGSRRRIVNGINTGTIHFYSTSTGNLITSTDNPIVNNSVNSHFGEVMAINPAGTHLAVGDENNGVVHVFDPSTGSIRYTLNNPNNDGIIAAFGDEFGISLDISDSYIIVGAPRENSNSGAAYIFDINTQALLYTLTNPNDFSNFGDDDDWFGYSVTLNDFYAYVSAKDERNAYSSGPVGIVYSFSLTDGTLSKTYRDNHKKWQNKTSEFGKSISASNGILAVGAPEYDSSIADADGQLHMFDLV